MTTNEPFGPEPSDSESSQPEASHQEAPHQEPFNQEPFNQEPSAGRPSWGNPSSTPPAGSGSEPGASFGTAQAGATTVPGARFFERVRGLGIVRPDPGQGRWIAGVAAGIARRYQVDPVVVRIAFGILTLFGGLGVLLYGLGWLFLPHPDGRIHAQQVLGGTVTAGFVGALLTVLAIAHHLIPILLIALVVWMIARHRRTNRLQAC